MKPCANFYFVKNICGVFILFSLWACAPQQPRPEVEPTLAPRELKPLKVITPTPNPVSEPESPEPETQQSAFDPDNPDWELRYQELYRKFASEFQAHAPKTGNRISVELKSGRSQIGVVTGRTPYEISLDITNGVVSYTQDSLSDATADKVLESTYARNRALEQGRYEYQRWTNRKQSPNPTPTTSSNSRENENEVAESTGGENGGNEDGDSLSRRGPPVNEGSTGRVIQVEEYIRKNSALPDSLRVKAWGKVQKHERGYKVRVQYSLESAGGFGTSNEDMMFFMTRSGRVYQKAAVK